MGATAGKGQQRMRNCRAICAVVAIGVLLGLVHWVDPSRWEALATARFFLLKGIANTFIYSAAGALIGIAGGFVLAAGRIYGRWPGHIAGAFIVCVQAVPALLIILACYLALPELLGHRISAEAAAVAALGLISSTYYCEAARAAIAAVDPLQWDVAAITGLPITATIFRLILPQALPAAVPAIGTASVIVYKLSTLLYPLGIQDFFRAAVLVNNHIIDPVLIYSILALFYFATCKALTAGVSWMASLYIKQSGGRLGNQVSFAGA
ncbi:MAG: ABC transporter permease subunit [Mesorhizobium sp.]|nr:MAG: ABC transporter permease subunit [Mesorhizobium sp.]